MFRLPDLQYDAISTMARLDKAITATLTELFLPTGRLHADCRLCVVGDSRSSACRSSVYVLDEGVLDSPRCFSPSKFRRKQTTWITPNGWRVAAVSSSLVFVGETKVIDGEMRFRFTLAGAGAVGQWSSKLQTAFAALDAGLSERSRLTLSKLSKEVVLGVHAPRVQLRLWDAWRALKRTLPSAELLLGERMEQQHRSAKPQRTPRSASGLLSPAQLAAVLSAAERRDVPAQSVREALELLDAGGGATVQCLLRFLEQIDQAVGAVWDCAALHGGLLAYWSEVAQHQSSLRFRAAVFVLSRTADRYPTLAAIRRQQHCGAFRQSLTALPPFQACRARLGEFDPT
ncbi:hypothetical protein BASA81_008850 [Batrachochytrium salamandrivorans]|nr:hypothetical protein BASA81_008850 [Batrachochytrium salamandrivorans]